MAKTCQKITFVKSAVRTSTLAAVVGIMSAACSYADAEHSERLPDTIKGEQIVQTTCPVITGNPIDESIYTDYEGTRVYFCCNSCKADFERDPEKYLSNLPQFASVPGSNHEHASDQHGVGLSILARLIVPMGIVTLSLIALTVALSIFRRANVRLMMKWHKRTGIAVLISAAMHAALVLIAH